MQAFFDSYLDRLKEMHADAGRAIQGLPTEALDWTAGEDIPSPAVLITHLTGAERYWIGDVARGDRSGRNRQAEFEVRGLEEPDLQKRLKAADEYARQAVGGLSVQDLEQVCTSPRDGRQFSLGWALLHALEHTALHVGHLQIIRQRWDQRSEDRTANV